jgi:hypothetical protein
MSTFAITDSASANISDILKNIDERDMIVTAEFPRGRNGFDSYGTPLENNPDYQKYMNSELYIDSRGFPRFGRLAKGNPKYHMTWIIPRLICQDSNGNIISISDICSKIEDLQEQLTKLKNKVGTLHP